MPKSWQFRFLALLILTKIMKYYFEIFFFYGFGSSESIHVEYIFKLLKTQAVRLKASFRS